MKVFRRTWVDATLDYIRFRLDRFPALDYQPLPWLGLRRAARTAGVGSRWRAIQAIVEEMECATGLDVGCNVGFYTIALAERGVATTGVDNSDRDFRLFLFSTRRLRVKNVGCLFLTVSPSTIGLLPSADCVLFLSVWHHLVRDFGLEAATSMTRAIWDRTNKVLFFETGEAEMPAHFGLPEMVPDAATYLSTYLSGACPGGRVVHLGVHDAFEPDGYPCMRNLFAVVRA